MISNLTLGLDLKSILRAMISNPTLGLRSQIIVKASYSFLTIQAREKYCSKHLLHNKFSKRIYQAQLVLYQSQPGYNPPGSKCHTGSTSLLSISYISILHDGDDPMLFMPHRDTSLAIKQAMCIDPKWWGRSDLFSGLLSRSKQYGRVTL